ncbi:MAG: DHA2 family efflux MFS transporter permease subunit [Ktedonobacteraceae bacterium]
MQQPSSPTQTTTRRQLDYKWIVALVTIFGAFMSILDQTIVNIAIPRLQTAFSGDLSTVQWVITAYTLTQGVVTPVTAFFINRLGTKRFYLLSLALFTIGSALCGIAWNLPILIAFRVFQGIGGAFLFPISITLLYQVFPQNQRGVASGILGIAALLAPAVGPTLGGYLVTYADWPYIFFINVPLGILAILLSLFLLRQGPTESQVSFDIPGFILAASGLTSVLYSFSQASTDGWTSPLVLGLLLAGILLLVTFVLVELAITRRGGHPLVQITLFASTPFTVSNITNVLVTFAFFGGLFIFPIYLQNLRGLSAFQAGLLLLPQAFASIITSLIGGRFVDRFGARVIILPGLFLLALVLWQSAYITLDTPFLWLQVIFVLRGLALGLIIQPLGVSAVYELQPQQFAQASSLNSVVRFVATSLGVAVLATLVQTHVQSHAQDLASQVRTASQHGQLLPRLYTLFQVRPQDLPHNPAGIVKFVTHLVTTHAYMAALQDAFWLSLFIAIAAFISACFISRKGSTTIQPWTDEERAAILKSSLD